MKTSMLIGIILIVVGVVALGYQGYIWVSGTEEVAHVGPVHIRQEKSFPVPIVPILGGLALAAGVVIVLRSSASRSVA